MTRLGVNIDHVATVRQARRETFPDPLNLALEAVRGGATGITAHLREDRRHIQDKDIIALKRGLKVPLNLEMGASNELIKIAEGVRPAWVCLVPEKREELTTEGGLNLFAGRERLSKAIYRLKKKNIRVSLFVEADEKTVGMAGLMGADAVELHTGPFANAFGTSIKRLEKELNRLRVSAMVAHNLGLVVNAGHGLNYENVKTLMRIHPFHELNIGFAIVAKALEIGMRSAVKEMKKRIG